VWWCRCWQLLGAWASGVQCSTWMVLLGWRFPMDWPSLAVHSTHQLPLGTYECIVCWFGGPWCCYIEVSIFGRDAVLGLCAPPSPFLVGDNARQSSVVVCPGVGVVSRVSCDIVAFRSFEWSCSHSWLCISHLSLSSCMWYTFQDVFSRSVAVKWWNPKRCIAAHAPASKTRHWKFQKGAEKLLHVHAICTRIKFQDKKKVSPMVNLHTVLY
jgi:hypothetical protein